MDHSRGSAIGGLRLSIAGLMILVGVIALDCAILVHVISLWDQSAALAVCLLIDVLPLITGAGIALLLALPPPARRQQQTRHPPLLGAGDPKPSD